MKAILLLTLSIIILSQSYGFVHAEHMIGHGIVAGESIDPDTPITVVTDSSSYETGETISVSGSVYDYDESDPYKNFDVTLRLIDPKNNIINISQLSPNDDGSYSTSILAQGPLWKFDGEYTISVSHGSDKNASTTFAFVLSEPEVIEVIEEEVIEEEIVPEEELAKGCGEGTHLEDGICVLDEVIEPTPVSTGSSPTTGSTSLMYSITFTVLIAFGIMIGLYLISRTSRNKTLPN